MDKAQSRWQADWKAFGDYLLGRSTLIGIASLMLLLISGYATWHGMRDFIIGVSGSGGHDSSGGLSIPNDLLVVIVVAALTFLMWLALRETSARTAASPNGSSPSRSICFSPCGRSGSAMGSGGV